MKKIIITLWVLSFTGVSYAQLSTKEYNEKENLVNWPEEFNPAKSKFYVYNEIVIDASPEKVWQILIEAEKWPDFYSGATNVKVSNTEGVISDTSSFIWETMGFQFTSVIKEFIPYQRLSWQSYKKGIPGYHAWVIIPTDGGCRLITAESQNGWITIPEKLFQPNKLLKLHDLWLSQIKLKAENNLSMGLLENERTNLIDILNESSNSFQTSIKGLSKEQLLFKPSSNKWSIAECIEHITFAELQFPEIVSEEMKKPSEPENRKRIKIKDEEIQPKMTSRKWKAKSPEIFRPSNKFKSVEEALSAYTKQRLATMNYVKNTNDDLRNHFWKHPLTGTIDLYQTLLLMSAHLERHTEQIEGLKENSVSKV